MRAQFKVIAFAFTLLIGSLSTANSGESAPAGGGHGKPAPSGGAPAKNPEWVELLSGLQESKAKVKMKEESVKKLIEEKHKTSDPKKVSEILKTLVQEHKDLQRSINDYEQKRNLLRFRFPEAGLTKDREYERIEGQSLETMESQMTVEGRLKRSLHKIRAKYGTELKPQPLIQEVEKPQPQSDPNTLAQPTILSQ